MGLKGLIVRPWCKVCPVEKVGSQLTELLVPFRAMLVLVVGFLAFLGVGFFLVCVFCCCDVGGLCGF